MFSYSYIPSLSSLSVSWPSRGCKLDRVQEEWQQLKAVIRTTFADKSYVSLWQTLLTKEPYCSDFEVYGRWTHSASFRIQSSLSSWINNVLIISECPTPGRDSSCVAHLFCSVWAGILCTKQNQGQHPQLPPCFYYWQLGADQHRGLWIRRIWPNRGCSKMDVLFQEGQEAIHQAVASR